MKKKEKTLSKSTQFSGKIFNVRVDQVEVDQQKRVREIVDHPGGVCILALNHKNEALVVEQYRYGAQRFMLELPAGKKERHEDPLLTAKRELLEETGFKANQWEPFGIFYPSPAYLNEVIYFYVAHDLEAKSQQLDEGEYLDTYFLSLDTLKEKALNNEITDGKTIALILRYCFIKNKSM
jgi:ADP-ribose pyrophosphatase